MPDPNIAPDVGGGKGETSLPEGFIPHDGGKCPVALGVRAAVMFRGGICTGGASTAHFWARKPYDYWRWESPDHFFDIIAYKVENPS